MKIMCLYLYLKAVELNILSIVALPVEEMGTDCFVKKTPGTEQYVTTVSWVDANSGQLQ